MRISGVALVLVLVAVGAFPFLACTVFDDLADPAEAGAPLESSTDAAPATPPSADNPPEDAGVSVADSGDSGDCTAAHEHRDATRCYLFNASRVGWLDAENACGKWGGHLVSVRDADELGFLRGLVKAEEDPTKSTGVWIGLNSVSKANEWMWTDKTPFAFTNWASTEPDNEQPPHQCVYQYGEQYVGHWDNFMCSVQAESVCTRAL